jgi:hypothetical protein
MFAFEIEIRNMRVLDYYTYLLEHIPQTTQHAVGEVVKKHREPLLERLRKAPAVHRPFIWTTARQRRAYLMTNGFGAGIPYPRTGRLENSWQVTTEIGTGDSVATVHFRNATPYVQFVEGFRQQPGHSASNWAYAPNAILATENQMVDDIGQELRATFRDLRDIRGGG